MTIKIRKKTLYLIIAILLVLIPLSVVWLNSNTSIIEYESLGMRPSMDIADNLHYSPQTQKFDTIVRSVGLDTFLHDSGPFTVFAPTNAAYAKLSTDFTSTVTDPTQEGTIRQIILTHVVKGTYKFSDFKDGMELTTLNGEKIKITKSGESWLVNGYAIIQTYDIDSKNGVIHTIDSFIIPPSMLQ